MNSLLSVLSPCWRTSESILPVASCCRVTLAFWVRGDTVYLPHVIFGLIEMGTVTETKASRRTVLAFIR
jgi:hypothetical protein